jgi:hypothetical protein
MPRLKESEEGKCTVTHRREEEEEEENVGREFRVTDREEW